MADKVGDGTISPQGTVVQQSAVLSWDQFLHKAADKTVAKILSFRYKLGYQGYSFYDNVFGAASRGKGEGKGRDYLSFSLPLPISICATPKSFS